MSLRIGDRSPAWRVRLQRLLDGGHVALGDLAHALSLVIRPAPLASGSYLALAFLLSVLPVVQVALTRSVVNGLVAGAAAPTLIFAVLYGLTILIPATLQPVQDTLMAWLEDRTVAVVDRRLMAAGARIPDLRRIEGGAFGDELLHLQDGAHQAPHLVPALPALLGALLTLVGLLLLLARLQPLIPLVLLLAGALNVASQRRLSRLKYNTITGRSRAAREMDYAVRMTTEPAAAKEIRIFGQGGFFLQRFRERFAAVLAEGDQARRSELRSAALITGFQALALAAGFWYVAAQAASGRLTLGDVALYLAAVSQTESRLAVVGLQYGVVHGIMLHIGGLFRFIESAGPSIAVAAAPQARPVPARLGQGIEFRDVSFRYPESAAAVLEQVSFTLPSSAVTALVGANGAGKSTIVKLLTRMYDQDTGEILLDGQPLAAYDLTSLRRRTAVVYQDFARFAMTFRENVAVGAPNGEATGDQIAAAVHWAGASTVLGTLLHGYETELTRRFEGGVELSGGQWQKVAIARAAIRDAALLILDEPTAALDAEAEYDLVQRFRALAAGRTVLLISHRFSTVRMADRIVVLEDGRVVEAGSHAELLARAGRYATLYELQAGRYR